MSVRYIVGDVFDVLASMKPASVDLAISSPPFLALRSYLPADHPLKAKEIGSEATPADFLDTLLDVTEAIARVLAPHGSLTFELGDTYAGSGGGGGDYIEGGWRAGQAQFAGSAASMRESNAAHWRQKNAARSAWPQDKSLCGIPTLFAWSLAYGRNLLRPERTTPPWRIRNLRPWVRNNPPVGALGDKVRPATSYMVVATKARDRWFDLDAVRKPSQDTRLRNTNGPKNGHAESDVLGHYDTRTTNPAGAPPLDWVLCNPKGYAGSHYAVWPEELLHEPIESMCPRRVCRACGAPSRRVVDTGPALGRGRTSRSYGKQVAIGEANVNGRFRPPDNATSTTTGWTTCGCPDADGLRLDGFHTGAGWRPGVVLDPFGGSGTTGVVAAARSRDAVLIDLDERNAELAYGRLGWMLEVEHHAKAAPA